MTDRQSQLEKARVAKKRAIERFGKLNGVSGFGISRRGEKYVVKINLSKSLSKTVKIPKTLNGVEVVLKTTGEIKKQNASSSAKSSVSRARATAIKGSFKTSSKKTTTQRKKTIKKSAAQKTVEPKVTKKSDVKVSSKFKKS